MSYLKEAFYPNNLQHAKEICITPNTNNPKKFEKETYAIIELLENQDLAWFNSEIADFGCGMGRVSKAIIDRFGSYVSGFDISEPMLYFATDYVLSKKFTPIVYSKELERKDYKDKFDLVLSLFVLQHSEDPKEDIRFIFEILKSEGKFIFINENKRLLPYKIDSENFVEWMDDGINIEEELKYFFNKESEHQYPNRYDIKLSIWTKKQ